MKTIIGIAVLCLLASFQEPPQQPQQPGFQDDLLDHFVGTWTLQGFLAGGEKKHTVVAEWVLGHQYLRFHEVSSELDDQGNLEYEAIVFIGWDEPSNRYACLWLDSTGGSAFVTPVVIGHAKRNGDALPFLFKIGDGSLFHTTFEYDRKSDSWKWRMDGERDGELNPFARLTMTRQ